MGKDLNEPLTKETLWVVNEYVKIFSVSFVSREMQIKMTMDYHYKSISMAKI